MHYKKRVVKPQSEVFDEEFNSFRETLAFACVTYTIKKPAKRALFRQR